MSEPRFTTILFRVSGSEDAYTVPGFGATPAGALDTVSDDDALRQSLLLLLSTHPGERVMRPTYGCPLERFVFAPNDETTAGLVIHEVRSSIERCEPRVEVVGIDVRPNPDDISRLEIEVSYRARASAVSGSVSVPLTLQP
jgi:phage baseplate assembly protein W